MIIGGMFMVWNPKEKLFGIFLGKTKNEERKREKNLNDFWLELCWFVLEMIWNQCYKCLKI